MTYKFNDLITDPNSKVTNPSESPIKVIDEFSLTSVEQEYDRAQAAIGTQRSYIGGEETKNFFNNYYTVNTPIAQNEYDMALGFLTARGYNRKAAEPLAKYLLQIAYYGQKPVHYYLEQLAKLPDQTAINIKILQILNDAGKGAFYLAVKVPRKFDTYVKRSIVA